MIQIAHLQLSNYIKKLKKKKNLRTPTFFEIYQNDTLLNICIDDFSSPYGFYKCNIGDYIH